MRPGTRRLLGILTCCWVVGACANPAGAGWTFGPTASTGPSQGAAGPTSSSSPIAAVASASPSIAPRPTPDGREPLAFPDVQSHGTVTVAFTEPELPLIEFDFACEWISPRDVGFFYIAPRVTIAGETVSLAVEPRSPGYQFWVGRGGAASYMPSPSTGCVGLDDVSEGWASGSIWFNGLAPCPEMGPGPLEVPIDEWVRPIGGDPAFKRLTGTVAWTCEPAPPTVPEPEPDATVEPGPTIPPLPRLTLLTDDVVRDAVSGCGASIDIDGYTAADSCGPSFQALGVDYIVRVREGDDLQFVLPAGWRFERWSLGWVSQIEAERWRGEQPDTFGIVRTGEASNGRVLEVDSPPVGDWTVLLDWAGAREDDSFTSPDYFRVLVE